MIYQVANVKTKTEPLPALNKGLIQARHIQARLKESAYRSESSNEGPFPNAAPGSALAPSHLWFD